MNIILNDIQETCDLENRIMKSSNQKADRKANETNESNIWDLWDSVKHANLHIIAFTEGESEVERYLKELWRKTELPKPRDGNSIQVQEAHKALNDMKPDQSVSSLKR